jgi:hypothetical protein
MLSVLVTRNQPSRWGCRTLTAESILNLMQACVRLIAINGDLVHYSSTAGLGGSIGCGDGAVLSTVW